MITINCNDGKNAGERKGVGQEVIIFNPTEADLKFNFALESQKLSIISEIVKQKYNNQSEV